MHFVMPIGLAASALSYSHLADRYRMVMLSGRHVCAISALPHVFRLSRAASPYLNKERRSVPMLMRFLTISPRISHITEPLCTKY